MSSNALYTDLSGYYDLMCADIDYQEQSNFVRRIHQIFGNQGRDYLDLACGTGPHVKHFINYVQKPTVNNTLKMAIAANLSGRAISISKTTAPHALSYPFTAYYNISHGHAVSLTLNKCLNFNFK